MKNLLWIGTSKKDLLKLPGAVKQEIGYALWMAQNEEYYENTKPLKGLGSGVFEIISDFNKNTYRAVYIVNMGDNIYVLHVFQKKSKTGIKTPQEEIALIKQRLKFLKTQIK
ncbi:MAG: type II toxin-antitoxin system RelE/ParE family toxin [Legionellales bacterium]|jgi:phage-related protein